MSLAQLQQMRPKGIINCFFKSLLQIEQNTSSGQNTCKQTFWGSVIFPFFWNYIVVLIKSPCVGRGGKREWKP